MYVEKAMVVTLLQSPEGVRMGLIIQAVVTQTHCARNAML